jgi:asparagine synthase (glutamine-hydrolysing)
MAGAGMALAGRISGDGRVERYGEALGQPLASQYFSRSSGPTTFFNRRARQFLTPDFLNRTAAVSAAGYVGALLKAISTEPLLNQMLYVDTKTWLPDDLLVKADKITMANSLELRVPLLDHVVLEFAASLPPDYKVRGRETKRILKSAFASVLPPSVVKRKKAGFPVPYEKWLRDELRERVQLVLLSDRAGARGYFAPKAVSRLLEANASSGKYSKEIFSLLIFELWHRQFVDQCHDSSSEPATMPLSGGVP